MKTENNQNGNKLNDDKSSQSKDLIKKLWDNPAVKGVIFATGTIVLLLISGVVFNVLAYSKGGYNKMRDAWRA